MVLVTGGTGLVGSHLLYELASKGDKIRAIYRKNSNLEAVKKVFSFYTDDFESLFTSIQWTEADITDIPALTRAFEGIEYVYHAAAFVSFDLKDYKTLRKTNIEGTANIVNLCIENKVKKLCFVSTIATLGTRKNNKFITEKTHWNPEAKNDSYAISKYGAEMEVWRGSQEGIKVIIVNPGIILGNGFFQSGSGKIFSSIQNGLNFYTTGVTGFVAVEDVATNMIKLTESNIYNEKFILISENWSFKDFLSTVAKALNKPLPEKKATSLLLKLLWFLDSIKSKLTGKNQTFTKAVIRASLAKNYYSNEKIKQKLNINFKPIAETIETISKQITQ